MVPGPETRKESRNAEDRSYKQPGKRAQEKGREKEDRRGSLNEPSFAYAHGRNASRHARLRAALDADGEGAV